MLPPPPQHTHTITCTDTSCFLFSEAWLPLLEAWSWSGTVLPLLPHLHNHTITKHTHAAYLRTNIQRRWHEPHKCRYSLSSISASHYVPFTFPLMERWLRHSFHQHPPLPLPKGDKHCRCHDHCILFIYFIIETVVIYIVHIQNTL